MKALLLAALGLITAARAQGYSFPAAPCYTNGPLWFQQNLANTTQTPPWSVSQEMRTVNGQTAWQLLGTAYTSIPPQNRGYGISPHRRRRQQLRCVVQLRRRPDLVGAGCQHLLRQLRLR